MLKKLAIIFLMTSMFAGCLKKQDSKDILSCNFNDAHFSNGTPDSFSPGEKVGQEFIVTRNLKMKNFIVQMDVQNSTSVTMSIYKDISNSPTDAQLLGQNTVSSSNYTSTDKVTFSFDSISMKPGEEYYFILESVGGGISVNQAPAGTFNIVGKVWKYRSGGWYPDNDYDMSFQGIGSCVI